LDSSQENNELNELQIRNINLLTHLLVHDAISDEIVENIRKNELEYFALLDKYKLLDEKVNLEEKTNLLKFKNDYLTEIIKTASRIYFGTEDSIFNISLVRFDIDDFSIFNNKYGHDIGDEVLIAIADAIRESSRPTDYVIRFGGEEIDVILPSTNIHGAEIYCSKVFNEVSKLIVPYKDVMLLVTVSCGISSCIYTFDGAKILDEKNIESLYKKLQSEADNALYEAKFLGKNRYCIFDKSKQDEYIQIRDAYSRK
jgi:two-component system cell cycle response regulator